MMILLLFLTLNAVSYYCNGIRILPTVLSLIHYDDYPSYNYDEYDHIPSIDDMASYYIKQKQKIEQKQKNSDKNSDIHTKDNNEDSIGNDDNDEESEDDHGLQEMINDLDPIDVKFLYSRTYQTFKKDIDTLNEEYCYDTRKNCPMLAKTGQCTNETFDAMKYNTKVSLWTSSHCKLSCSLCDNIVTYHFLSSQFNPIQYHENKHPTIHSLETITKT